MNGKIRELAPRAIMAAAWVVLNVLFAIALSYVLWVCHIANLDPALLFIGIAVLYVDVRYAGR